MKNAASNSVNRWVRRISIYTLSALALFLFLKALVFGGKLFFDTEFRNYRDIEEGMSEQQVIDRLGVPYRIFHHNTTLKEDYYIDGYSFRKRAITNKVLVYVGAESIAYIYIDHQGKVEDRFVGGS